MRRAVYLEYTTQPKFQLSNSLTQAITVLRQPSFTVKHQNPGHIQLEIVVQYRLQYNLANPGHIIAGLF